jgi:hypothetical protein
MLVFALMNSAPAELLQLLTIAALQPLSALYSTDESAFQSAFQLQLRP